MRTRFHASVLAASLVLAVTGPALARDYCFDAGGIAIVARDFRLPRRNRCTPLMGNDSLGKIVTGTACLNDAQDMLRVGYTLTTTVGYTTVEVGHMDIPSPSLTGGSGRFNEFTYANGVHSTATAPASVVACSASSVAIP